MADSYSNSSSTEEINCLNVLMNNYKNYFTKRCRTCFSVIKDNACIDSFELNAKETSLRDKLYACCPEFDLISNLSIILCLNCSQIINIIDEFICKYNKSKGLTYSNFSFSPLLKPNMHLFNNLDITFENEIKIEDVDLSNTKISLNVHEQVQSIKNTQKCLKSNMKTTLYNVEELSKHSQCDDTIYKNVPKESLSGYTEEGSLKYSYHNYRNHTQEKPFKCPKRRHNTTCKNYLKSYFCTQTGDKPIKCFQCDFSTAFKSSLLNHLRTHTEDKSFKCSHCEYSCAYKNNLNRHLRTHTGDKPFKCSKCEYSSAQRTHLNLHFRTHTGDKPFKCSKCEYSCARRSQLNCHLRTHTGDRPFKCFECEFRTAHRNSLVNHCRVHTGDKPFKCSKCEYSCALRNNLNRHFRTHTGDKPFKCSNCVYSFAQKSHLTRHFRTHTGEKPFKCFQCDYSTAHKKCLVNHCFTHTGGKPFK